MKITKLGAIIAVAAATLSISSCTTGSNEITDRVDSLSYAEGMIIANMYKQQLNSDAKINIDEFVKGFEEALKADTTEYSVRIGQLLGTQINMTLEREAVASGMEVNKAMFMKSFKDALNSDSTAFTATEADIIYKDIMQRGAKEIAQAEEDKLASAPEAVENKAKSEAFFADVEKESGVVKTESGLLYKVISKGKGEKVKKNDNIVMNYRGLLMDGTEFDKGDKVTARASQFIPGYTEALQLMSKGAKYKVYIPAELAYGVRGVNGKIGANEAIIFEIEVVEIK